MCASASSSLTISGPRCARSSPPGAESTIHDGLATYDETYRYDQYGYWKGDRRGFVVDCLRELTKVAEDYGIVLAMQNHGPDIVNNYQDVLAPSRMSALQP